MAEPSVCPDCGLPVKFAGEEGTLADSCFARRESDWLGATICKDKTIARLRGQVTATKAAVERAKGKLDGFPSDVRCAFAELIAELESVNVNR